jgi:hypothetical protein
MKQEISKNRLTANISNILLIAVLLLIIFSGAYQFSKSLNEDIQHKEEIDSLTIERLKLEIELKKLELSRKNNNQHSKQ